MSIDSPVTAGERNLPNADVSIRKDGRGARFISDPGASRCRCKCSRAREGMETPRMD